MSTEAQTKVDEAARKLKLPLSQYKLRVIEAKGGETPTTKTPKIDLTCEIFDHKTLINGVDVNGLQIRATSFLTPASLPYVNRIRQALDLPDVTEDTLADIKPEEYVGCEGIAKCSGSSEPQMDEVTGEQMTDPYSGEELNTVKREVKEWYPRPRKA